MTRYRTLCSDTEHCKEQSKFTTNFVPRVENKVCDKCGKPLTYTDDTISQKTNESAKLVSGVGEIGNRLSGDWKDLMKSIKRGSPRSNMPDY